MKVYEKFGLCAETIDFIGHCVALYPSDGYLKKPCGEAIKKCQLYWHSINKYSMAGNDPK
jgi:Rab GDP dissociation inhibitor